MTALLMVVGSGIGVAVLTPVVRRLALHLGTLDEPGGRRRHRGPVPRGGGLAIGLVMLAATLGIWVARSDALVADNPDAMVLVAGLLIGGALSLVLGLWDDFRDLHPAVQLGGQLALAAVAIGSHLWFQTLSNPLGAGVIDLRAAGGVSLVAATTVVWYVGFINTVNWLDGIDGLAAGVSAVAAALFAVHMVVAFDQHTLALIPLALAGACLGFLPWNMGRRQIFMGSSGSTFLGFMLAALALIAPAKVATALLVMAVPIVDVGWQIVYRLRRGRRPWEADRGHLHHRLYDRGWSPAQVVLLYVAFSAALGALAVSLPEQLAFRAQWKLFALVATGVLTAGYLWHLARKE